MLLGGIVIVIGVMMDGVIVMIENMYKYMEVFNKKGVLLMDENCW